VTIRNDHMYNLIETRPDLTDAEIAALAGCQPRTVARARVRVTGRYLAHAKKEAAWRRRQVIAQPTVLREPVEPYAHDDPAHQARVRSLQSAIVVAEGNHDRQRRLRLLLIEVLHRH